MIAIINDILNSLQVKITPNSQKIVNEALSRHVGTFTYERSYPFDFHEKSKGRCKEEAEHTMAIALAEQIINSGSITISTSHSRMFDDPVIKYTGTVKILID